MVYSQSFFRGRTRYGLPSPEILRAEAVNAGVPVPPEGFDAPKKKSLFRDVLLTGAFVVAYVGTLVALAYLPYYLHTRYPNNLPVQQAPPEEPRRSVSPDLPAQLER